MTWAGVDVGGRRKGFDAAVIGDNRVTVGSRLPTPSAVVEWLAPHRPIVVAVDSPCRSAEPGRSCRDGERELASHVCGIRWTPEEARLQGNPYYQWIVNGLDLYGALECGTAHHSWEVIEVFPTASWTRWGGKRDGRTRAAWSGEILGRLGLSGVPERTSQDVRDAIAAAQTARLCSRGSDAVQRFGDIVVPIEPLAP